MQPVLIAEVAFTEWTDDHLIRPSSFQGLREDKSAKEIEEEKPAVKIEQKKNPRARNGKFKLTNPDKVLYQKQGLTKKDLALYYEAVADSILPHVRNRPLTLVRCPNGSKGQTAVAAFSTRAKPGATVSVPLDWKELKTGLRPDQWNVLNLGERRQRLRRDPWQDFFDVRQRIAGRMKQTLGL
ncbi:MAG: hypothetical protein ACREUI_09510 [Burkholderiales bacterium]